VDSLIFVGVLALWWGAADMVPPAPGCPDLSGAVPTPVGGDGQLCGTRRQRVAMIAPVVKDLVRAFISEADAALRAHLDKRWKGVFDGRAASAEACQQRAGRIMPDVSQAPFEVCAVGIQISF
jgi:hypothetical protein